MNKVLLDVRTFEEFRVDGLEGSINIPHTEITRRIDELSKNDKILVYCRSGVRAGNAGYILNLLGYNAENVGTVQDARLLTRGPQ